MAAATTAAAAAVVSSTAATARADDTAAARRKRYDQAQSTLQKTLRPSTTAPTVEICVRPQLAHASGMMRLRGGGGQWRGQGRWGRGHGVERGISDDARDGEGGMKESKTAGEGRARESERKP